MTLTPTMWMIALAGLGLWVLVIFLAIAAGKTSAKPRPHHVKQIYPRGTEMGVIQSTNAFDTHYKAPRKGTDNE